MSAQHRDPRTQSIINAIERHGCYDQFVEILLQIQKDAAEEAGDGTLARFKQAVDAIMTVELKTASASLKSQYSPSRTTSGGSAEWRSELKAHFGGRGRQWVKVSLEAITETIERLEADGHDAADYKQWTTSAGYAWVRYAGPRIHDDKPSAAFEVRLNGSRMDHIGLYHYVPADEAYGLEFLPNTPFGLALER